MALDNLTRKVVTGLYVKSDGTLATGSVTFTPSAILRNPAEHALVLPAPQTATVTAGTFSITLLATDDPDATPAFVWNVTERIVGGTAAGAIIGGQVKSGDKGKVIGGLIGGAIGAVAAHETGTEAKLAAGSPLVISLASAIDIPQTY